MRISRDLQISLPNSQLQNFSLYPANIKEYLLTLKVDEFYQFLKALIFSNKKKGMTNSQIVNIGIEQLNNIPIVKQVVNKLRGNTKDHKDQQNHKGCKFQCLENTQFMDLLAYCSEFPRNQTGYQNYIGILTQKDVNNDNIQK
ncbi:hypothetical protein ABPG74_000399 [Tetrahymena malaccensis]